MEYFITYHDHFILKVTLKVKYYYPYFTDKETEVQDV